MNNSDSISNQGIQHSILHSPQNANSKILVHDSQSDSLLEIDRTNKINRIHRISVQNII
jgi:hypothetical protein